MKYGLFKYDYIGYGDYMPQTINIGDYIQSLAASQYIKRVDYYVDRDSMANEKREMKLIANGWFYINKEKHSVPENLTILPISIHVNNRGEGVIETIKTFIKKSDAGIAIGCRDFATLNYLRSNNIPSYFSSCLTTTLTKKCLNINDEGVEREGIILTDAPRKARVKIFPITRILNEVKKYPFDKKIHGVVMEILKHYDGEKIEFVRHEYQKQEMPTHEQRFEMAKNILKKYARARLVITSRIHCALPCLALGTPVVLVTKKYDNLRYGGLTELLNHVWLNDLGEVQSNFKINSGEIKNSDAFVKYAENLRKICSEFINE